MAKKTSVVLPGGIAGLVHQVQNGGEEPKKSSEVSRQPEVAPAPARQEVREEPRAQQPAPAQPVRTAPAAATDRVGEGSEVAEPAPRRGRPAAPRDGVSPTEKAEREYQIVKDSGADSWDLFLSLGKIYKTRDERLATIYIDPDLKRILDRLKTASSVKLPTAAILSSIVARFIFDHEKEINDVIFGERLI